MKSIITLAPTNRLKNQKLNTMKAKLFTSPVTAELRLSNKVSYFAKPGETLDTFLDRAKVAVKKDYKEELDYKVVNMANIKRRGTSQLQGSLKRATGAEKQMMQEVLIDRGVSIEVEPEVDLSKLNTGLLTEMSALPTEKPKAKALKEFLSHSLKVKKESKAPRKRVKKPKMEPTKKLITCQNKAKKSIGQHCQFIPFGEENAILGTIKYVATDKRVNKVYFRIQDDAENGKLYCCASDNKTLILNVNP